MKLRPIKSAKKGFSLVEMLVVIAVIGIIAAIAVPNIGKINDSAKDATYRRNAQTIASVFSSAQAAGYDFSKADGVTGTSSTDKTVIVGRVITGQTIPSTGTFATSPFKGAFFGVPNVSTSGMTATTGIYKYLNWDAASGTLRYLGDAN